MKYLDPRFTVAPGGTEEYRKNYDSIRWKDEDEKELNDNLCYFCQKKPNDPDVGSGCKYCAGCCALLGGTCWEVVPKSPPDACLTGACDHITH